MPVGNDGGSDVTGIDDQIGDLGGLEQLFQDASVDAVTSIQQDIVEAAKSFAPDDEELKDSIQAGPVSIEGDQIIGTVTAGDDDITTPEGVSRAEAHELGAPGLNIPGRHFVERGVMDNMDRVLPRTEDRFASILDQLGGSEESN